MTHPGGAHRGGGATANLAHAASQGEFCRGLPSDDMFASTQIERQVTGLAGRPDAGFVYSYAALVYAAGRPIRGARASAST